MNTAGTPEAAIKQLETEIESLREGLKKKVTPEILRAMDEKQAEITRLRDGIEHQKTLKEEYRRKYRATIPLDADFERLWETRLRDEALLENTDTSAQVRAASTHGIYKSW